MTATPKDLQYEVGRLRAENSHMREALQHIVDPAQHHECCMDAWKRDDLDNHMVKVALDALAKTPPESADEKPLNKVEPQIRHKRMQAFNQKLEELGVVDNPAQSSQPQACEHHWRTLSSGKEFCGRCKTERDAPQSCRHNMLWRSSGGTYCTFCKSWLNAPNSTQVCEHEWECATLFDTDNTETHGMDCVKCLKFVATQDCEHKGSIDTYQGKPFCKRCGAIEPTVIPPLKCPKCGSSAVHVDRKKRIHCYECKAVSEPANT